MDDSQDVNGHPWDLQMKVSWILFDYDKTDESKRPTSGELVRRILDTVRAYDRDKSVNHGAKDDAQ